MKNCLQERARANKRSLNNYIEFVLYSHVDNMPNEITKRALEDAYNDIKMVTIDDLEEYKRSLLDAE